MKKLFIIAIAATAICSCGKKKDSNVIITKVDTTQVVRQDTVAMAEKHSSQKVEWDNHSYTVRIDRKADKSLTVVQDSQDNFYYDNAIMVQISGPEGTVLNHTFYKKDFMSMINPEYMKPSMSVLSSIAVKGTDDGRLELVASVGSPDQMDDNYMLVEISVDKHGSISKKLIDEDDDLASNPND